MAQTRPQRRRTPAAKARPRPWIVRRPYLTAGVVIAIAAALAIYFVAGRAGSSSAPTATGSFLAPAPDYGGHPITDNIPCEQTERITYHVHAHLAIFVNGQPSGVPYGIGIAPPRQTQDTPDGPFVVGGSCFYWLHTHDATGVIHVEGPNPQNFTLGQFFDVWQQPLSASQVGPQQGTVIAYLNGQKFSGDPRTIPLAAHNLIQLDLGQDTPPASYTFAPGL